MPDHKETGPEPTEQERETTFAPHQSPSRQGDGDPGVKDPSAAPAAPGTGTKTETETGDADAGEGDVAGDRGKWSGLGTQE